MRIALCNEVVREMPFDKQCRFAASLGYDGLEVAPFTLSENPHLIDAGRRAELRRMASDAGISITGLHWLLLTPEGLSVNSPDRELRNRTIGVMKGLVDLCSDLGGEVLVHGSPKQRNIGEGENRREAEKRAEDSFSQVAPYAEQAGVVYCIEPLTSAETNYINNLEEASDLVQKVANRAFRSMLDTKAARGAENDSVEELLHKWSPSGLIAHVHVNDRNLKGPGQGEDRFAELFSTLREVGYQGVVGVEPFDYVPDGSAAAARAIGYIRGILEVLES